MAESKVVSSPDGLTSGSMIPSWVSYELLSDHAPGATHIRVSESRYRVRPATLADLPRLADVLALAFQDDPVTRSHFPPGGDVIPTMRRFFGSVLEGEFLPRGLVLTTEDVAAVAVWLPPHTGEAAEETEDDGPPGFIRELFGAHAAIVEEIIRIQRLHHLTERHYYLQFMGTLPDKQGRGIGSAVLAPVLERCDEEQLPAYLDASSERSRDFYLGRGFEVFGELPLSTGARFWQMRRLSR